MKRLLLAVLMFFAATTVAYAGAPDRVGRLDWGVSGGGAFNDGNLDDTGYVQTSMSWGLTPYIAIGAEGGYQEADGAADETVGTVQVMGDIILRNPDWHDNLVPFINVGLGVIGNWVEDEDGVAPTNNGDDVDDTSFGWKIGGGFDWFIDQNWILNFEVAWFDSSNDLPRSSVDGDAGEFLTVVGGVKFAF